MKNCNTCKFINMTEDEQHKIKRETGIFFDHVCINPNIKFMRGLLKHYRFDFGKADHEFIIPNPQCGGDYYLEK